MTNRARGRSWMVAVIGLAFLAGCAKTVDEMVMNPNTKDEMVQKLVQDDVAKHDIMNKLTTEDASKKESKEV